MRSISNAMMEQAEIVLTNRWDYGPLELVFVPIPSSVADDLQINGWNRHHRGGFLRGNDEWEAVQRLVPRLVNHDNPNVFLVPTCRGGYTELHTMLASVVNPAILRRHRLEKRPAIFWLWPASASRQDGSARLAASSEQAFAEYIWPKLTGGRGHRRDYAANSSLRILASDSRFWMQRLYRIALARAEEIPPVEQGPDDDWWQPLDVLWNHVKTTTQPQIPEDIARHVVLTRPQYGGTIWDIDDQDECDAVVDEMLDGGDVMESIEPVLEAIRIHPTQEDFSDRFSWVKSDFERSFHSKRNKLKITMIETVDDALAWSADDATGYENVLFRDILAVFNQRDRRLILALRLGKTVSEIARDSGLGGHAAISRRVSAIKAKVRRLLEP